MRRNSGMSEKRKPCIVKENPLIIESIYNHIIQLREEVGWIRGRLDQHQRLLYLLLTFLLALLCKVFLFGGLI